MAMLLERKRAQDSDEETPAQRQDLDFRLYSSDFLM